MSAHSSACTSEVGVVTRVTRGQRIWNRLRNLRDEAELSLNRAQLATQAYRQTEGQPTILRRARAHAKILAELPIYIDDEQLLAGDFASTPMGFEWWPELTVGWVGEALESGTFPYRIDPSQHPAMKEIVDYWKDREAKQSFWKYMGPDAAQALSEMNERGSLVFFAEVEAQLEKGWHVPNYPKVMRVGLTGIIAEIDEELAKTRVLGAASYQKCNFLRALRISCEAGIGYAKRYAALARELASESEPERRRELETIAETCDWVLEHPARNFRDAMQTLLFTHLLIFWDVRLSGMSPGRVDQYLYPYYQRDIDEGVLSREEALELLECFRVKLSSMRQFDGKQAGECRSGETQFHNCTLGGQLEDGRDAVNAMSFLWLEAADRVRTAHPTLTVRWHPGLSHDFAMKAVELNRVGLGFPAWYCDETSIGYLENLGITHEDALNYVVSGCVLHTVPHKWASAWPCIVNLAKVLELALNNGVDPVRGRAIGPPTGHFEDFENYEDLWRAFQAQTRHFAKLATDYLSMVRVFRAYELPNLFVSGLIDDCIERGENVFAGGAHYQQSSMYMMPCGVVDVGDSLAAIKKFVFEDAQVGKSELVTAMSMNWRGHERLRKKLLGAPKFGNDDDYVDFIVRDIYSFLLEVMNSIEAPYGSVYEVAPHSLSFHGAAGRAVGALPSGRLAGVALCDGACSPSQGLDRKGPAAVINSAGKIDHTPIYGTLFNMKFHPSALATEEDLEKLLALIETYFGTLKGKHIQFNVVDRETLLDAQLHPENYRNLVVRVAGYSALWVELDDKIQGEIIARTEQRH